MSGDWWIAGVVGLQALATATYLAAGDWKQAMVWGGGALSNTAYLLLTRA